MSGTDLIVTPDVQCPDCPKKFKLKSSLRRHEIHIHRGVNNFKCNECNASFAQRVNLRVHKERLHHAGQKGTPSKRYSCSECSCSFTQLNTLNRHKSSRHDSQKNNNTELLKDDTIVEDPNQLAELIVAQLKSLEKEISCTVNADLKNEKFEVQTSVETTVVDKAEIGQTTIVDRLHPDGLRNTIEVQTIKRVGNRVSYVCEYCAKEFKKRYNFIRHLRIHNKERPYKCSTCSKCFGTKSQMQAHERVHILDEKSGFITNRYKCCICGLNFASIILLDAHIRTHSSEHVLQYLCLKCSKKFSTLSSFSKHNHYPKDADLAKLEELLPEPIILDHSTKMVLPRDTRKFLCNLCGLRLQSEEALTKHLRHHNTIKVFKCRTCGRSYPDNISLRVHQKDHKTMIEFACNPCEEKTFITQSQRNVQCIYCSKTFKSKIHCKSHMKNHLKCLLINENDEENSTTKSPLKAKAIIQTLNKTPESTKFVEIELLPKCTKHKHNNFEISALDRNLTSEHAMKAQHSCRHCSKHFQKPSDLARHARIHTKERPFQCDICEKKFTLKSTLDDHQKTHQNQSERSKLTCQVCGKSYVSAKSLSLHLRLHTGALPFKCDFCGKAFRTSGHRLSHMRASKSKNGQCKISNNVNNVFI